MSASTPEHQGTERAAKKADLSTPDRLSQSLILLLVIIGLICFWGLGSVDLLDLVDEGTYATIARRMIESGDFITPRVGADIFFYKPPLLYWCQAFFMKLLGFTPLASRLPSAFAAAATSLTVYFWGKRNGVPRVGWLAGVFYVLSPLTAVGLARISMMDSLLTLWFTLAVIGWIEGYRGHKKGYLLMAASVGLATMTKGMIGFLLPGAAFGLWLVMRRDWREFRKFPWIWTLLIFAAIVVPWHFAAWRANGNFFFQEYIVRQHFLRFLGQDAQNNMDIHILPFWYYVPVLVLAMAPFSFFVPAAWWRGIKAWRSDKLSLDCAMSIWALWALVIFLFFSAGTAKLPSYMLPVLPPFALLAARRLNANWDQKRGLAAIETAALWTAAAVPGAILLFVGISGWQWRSDQADPPPSARLIGKVLNWKEYQSSEMLWQKLTPVTVLAPYWIFLGVLFLFCLVLFVLFRKTLSKTILVTVFLSSTMLFVLLNKELPLWASNWVPLKELSLRTLPSLERQEPLVLYSMRQPRPSSVRYILGHNDYIYETPEPAVLQDVLNEKGHGYVIAVKDTEIPPLPGTFKQEAEGGKWVLWRYDDGAK